MALAIVRMTADWPQLAGPTIGVVTLVWAGNDGGEDPPKASAEGRRATDDVGLLDIDQQPLTDDLIDPDHPHYGGPTGEGGRPERRRSIPGLFRKHKRLE